MIADSIAFLRATGKRVIYDAEHFFDGYRAEPAYALRCIRAAAEAGAETVVAVRHQRLLAALADRRRDARRRSPRSATPSASGSTATTTPSAGSRTRSRRSRSGRARCRGR